MPAQVQVTAVCLQRTRCHLHEAMGMSLPYSSTMAAEDEEKKVSAAQSAEVLVKAIKKGIRPRDLITRKSL